MTTDTTSKKPGRKVAAKTASGKTATATAAKTPARPKPAGKPVASRVSVPAASPLSALPAAPGAPVSSGGGAPADMLRKKELIAHVVKAIGGQKKGVKEIVEATLAALGDALSRGRALNLPPLGKAKVARAGDAATGKAMTLKLKRGGPQNGAKTPLANDGDDG